jgi:hypothetical protein
MSEQPEEVEPERTPENSLDIDALWQKAEVALKERLEMFHHVPSCSILCWKSGPEIYMIP